MNSNELFNSLFNDYEKYREQKLNIEIIKHADVVNLVNEIGEKEIFRIEMIGCSVEGREIFSISFGTGKTKILAWSQMHGNECTATAALFDILNLFSAADIYNKFRTDLLSKTTFHFIPMLNPDGAEKYKRENAFNIDLNRDTLRLESPESEILWQYANKIQPAFAFNMHDQNSYYTAGRKNKTSAISLLAPPVDYAKSINYVREKSMQVICKVYEVLSNFIPGQIARYKDDFEPRAFGDNFTKKGISTILVESGFYKGDPDKSFIRKLNFVALLSAFNSIAEKNFDKVNYTKYFDIPENEQLLFDLLLRNITLNYNENKFTIDIGINREKFLDETTQKFFYKNKIAELGDLSIFYGIEDYDLNGYEVITNKILAVDEPADFELSKNGRVEFEVINGFLQIKPPQSPPKGERNMLGRSIDSDLR